MAGSEKREAERQAAAGEKRREAERPSTAGDRRREGILAVIRGSDTPVPAKTLAETYQVSRQVIVQDIALIRAAGYDIIATNRGYLLHEPKRVCRAFKVSHTEEQLEDELCTMVDLGGKVQDVYVNHHVYGRLRAELNITSRRHVAEFMHDIQSGKSSPLMKVTSNYHYHTVEADSEATLDLIQEALQEKGYLLSVADPAKK